MNGKYSGKEVAAFIVEICNSLEVHITNLKLQYLLYFAQEGYYKRHNERIIKDDFFAKSLGPVIKSLYDELSVFTSSNLCSQLCAFESNNCLLKEDGDEILDIILPYINKQTFDLMSIVKLNDAWVYTRKVFGDSTIPYETIQWSVNEEKKNEV